MIKAFLKFLWWLRSNGIDPADLRIVLDAKDERTKFRVQYAIAQSLDRHTLLNYSEVDPTDLRSIKICGVRVEVVCPPDGQEQLPFYSRSRW